MALAKLKKFQQDAVDAVLSSLNSKENRILLSLPPGTGQALILALVLEAYYESNGQLPVLVLSPSRSFVEQIHLAFGDIINANVGLLRNGFINDPSADIILADIQETFVDGFKFSESQINSMGLVVLFGFQQMNDSLEAVLNLFSNSIQLAISPNDELSNHFGNPVYHYTVREAVADDIFVPIKVKHIQVRPLDDVDFKNNDEFLTKNQAFLRAAAKSILFETNYSKTIVYCASTEAATLMAKLLNEEAENALAAGFISARSPDIVNDNSIRAFADSSGVPFYVCVVNPAILRSDLFTVARNVALVRSVNKLSVLQSMLLPALRKTTEKSDLLLLDYMGINDLFKQLDYPRVEEVIEALPENSAVEEMEQEQGDDENKETIFASTRIAIRDKKNVDAVLGVDDLAAELAAVINMLPAEKGAMIGVFGKWGRGKTFLMDKTWDVLEKGKIFSKIEYHAWKYQDTPATWAYLYECLHEAYLNKGNTSCFPRWLNNFFKTLGLNYERKGFWPIFKFIAIAIIGIIGIVGGYLFSDVSKDKGFIQHLMSLLTIPLALSVTIYTLFISWQKEYGSKAKDLFLKYTGRHSYKEHMGLQAEIQNEVLELLKTWIPKDKVGKEKLIFFIEDLDRCKEEKIIEVIDSLRVLLEDEEIAERMIIVAAVDKRILKLAIKFKYRNLIAAEEKVDTSSDELNRITNEYIDKLFITGIKLGELSDDDKDEFFKALTKEDSDTQALKTLEQLIIEERSEAFARYSPEMQELITVQDIQDHQDQMYQDELAIESGVEYYQDYLEGSKVLDVAELTPADLVLDNKLSADEIDVLRIALKNKYEAANPRQIRIFYYRYLIAKNLLIRRYVKLGRSSTWQLKRNSKILALAILHYTPHQNEHLLSLDLKKASGFTGHSIEVKELTGVTITIFDYRELLKVLDIVIAY